MDKYIFRFVCDEMQLQEKEQVENWQQILCRLFGIMLRDGMPMEELAPRQSFKEEIRQSSNAEESLFAVINSCARVTGQLSKIKWQGSYNFGTWLKQMQTQKFRDSQRRYLSMLDLREQHLIIYDLALSNFQGSDLQGANLAWANFIAANLRDTTLREADLSWANFGQANLKGADLREAKLKEANLKEANLEGANLEGANLEGANLKEANLEGANLEGANLKKTILDPSRTQS